MFGWIKKKPKNDGSKELLRAVIDREIAVKNAKRKMNLLIVDQRFRNDPVHDNRRQVSA